ncbi:MAG: response regulator [Gammaproteobacteria bacterium]|nr:response regulator [Gammaproteobacteria bacterium]
MIETSKRLLIIDDDAGIRSQLKWGFDDFDVYTADNRANAISQFKQYHPSVVTLDLGLPPDEEGESEGFAILYQLISLAPETKIIIVSGSESPINADKAASLGAFHYYPKPINLEQLKQIVEKAYQAYLMAKCKK